jgi:hypothetical protein
MYLLIVILLTGPGTMSEPFVSATATEADCLRALPLAVEVAEKAKGIAYVAICVPVQRAGV